MRKMPFRNRPKKRVYRSVVMGVYEAGLSFIRDNNVSIAAAVLTLQNNIHKYAPEALLWIAHTFVAE